MRYLVTGAGGLIGSHLVERLLQEEQSVFALVHRPSSVLAAFKGDLHTIQDDVMDATAMVQVVDRVRPDVVFHLASQSLPMVAWEKPEWTCRVNISGTINLLEAICRIGINPQVVVTCSSSEYASSTDGAPIAENSQMKPSSIYAVSKLAQDHISRLYHEVKKLHIVRAMPFFVIGPRKRGDVCSDFSRGIVQIERGQSKELLVGNMEMVRDFLDVRDGVAALVRLALQGVPGEAYNICSGTGRRVADILAMLKGMAKVPIHERVDSSRFRLVDEPVRVGNPSKLLALGWSPSVAIETTLEQILEYWRTTEI